MRLRSPFSIGLCGWLAFSAHSFAAQDWPMIGGDWANTRYSTLDQINTRTVKSLGAAWQSQKFDEGGSTRITPVVKNGLLFMTAGRKVYAFDAKSGERVWAYQTIDKVTQEELEHADLKSPAIPNSKGVGVGQGLVFVGLSDGHVIALKEKTGQLVWSRQTGIDEHRKGQLASTAPEYVNGVVLTGLADGDAFLQGRISALDAASGKILWQIYAIPGPGEPGHETWPAFNDAWKFGGGGVWVSPAVDSQLGLAYFATGNPVPAYAGDWRPGDNLFTSSVLAVDIHTGKLKWYYQLVHHDLWEGDVGTPVILYDARVDGRIRKALAVMRADGYLFQLDRLTGKPILPVEERPVPQSESQKTSPTQPYPVNGESILMSCEEWKKEKIPAGFVVGCAWTPPSLPLPSNDPPNVLSPVPSARASPMAYSPRTGFFYAQGRSQLFWSRRSQDPYFTTGMAVRAPGLKTYGELAAIDARTGKIAWKEQIPLDLLVGGPLATAGGLIFRSAGDGNAEARDERTGEVLWRFQTGMGGGSWKGGAPVTYEIDGEQYVAMTMGPAIWAFKLNGSYPGGRAPTISTQDEEFSGPIVDTDEVETTSHKSTSQEPGKRYFTDEFAFDPYRARMPVGAKMTFVNNGLVRHEIMALDGSWGTGPLSPTQLAWVRFDKPGQYAYICKDHPWAYGQIIVTASDAASGSGEFAEQAKRGREQYAESCGVCHGADLEGHGAAGALVGNAFLLHWGAGTVGDLFNKIRTTMPQTKPGSLDQSAYLDLVAYILQANDLSASAKLTDDPKKLQQALGAQK